MTKEYFSFRFTQNNISLIEGANYFDAIQGTGKRLMKTYET